MGDGDRRCGREAMCTPMEFDLMGVENHLWRLFRLRKWASRRRPDIAAVDVAQIEPMARLRIAGGNPGERILVPADASGAVRADSGREATIPEDLPGRIAVTAVWRPAVEARNCALGRGLRFPDLDPCNFGRQLPRNPRVEKEIDGSHMRSGERRGGKECVSECRSRVGPES